MNNQRKERKEKIEESFIDNETVQNGRITEASRKKGNERK